MGDFWFYIKLGFDHVLDFSAYDHILFLAALAIPFSFKDWRRVVILATIFTITHCTSLALSVYNLVSIEVGLIEFLIPVTIAITALLNVFWVVKKGKTGGAGAVELATAFFGLIHGFGFSNYFNMLMAEEPEKLTPLLGFATGIEFSQVVIILAVLIVGSFIKGTMKVKTANFTLVASLLIVVITIPMLLQTFPS